MLRHVCLTVLFVPALAWLLLRARHLLWIGSLDPAQLSLEGAAVLVTGAASGVGLEAAKFACSGGATVLVHARNRSDSAAASDVVLAACRAARGGGHEGCRADAVRAVSGDLEGLVAPACSACFFCLPKQYVSPLRRRRRRHWASSG
ncbi:unnamed protein product [Prorocentrum cordatum]|uniref:Protochlorophyllide reductase n=1 Tax=Prorocentrum cordatum TaxID=2364126 RepID=A0ABN9TSQ1_9DINO|nr:unnamed protein product [Polarella glacialis]